MTWWSQFGTSDHPSFGILALETVEEFFERGPRKVMRLRAKVNTSSNWVEPETLVDFLAVEKLAIRNSGEQGPEDSLRLKSRSYALA